MRAGAFVIKKTSSAAMDALLMCLVALSASVLLVLLVSWRRRNRNQPRQPFTFGTLIDPTIDLRYIPSFLTQDECDHLISLSKDKFARSQVITGTDTSATTDARTSHSHNLSKAHDITVSSIERRTAELLGADLSQVEGLQTVRYLPGQQFEQHHDWFQPDYRAVVKNQREHTLFVYLNDVHGEGGETDFPLLRRSFKPKRGDALFWRNCTGVDQCHTESLHQGKAPVDDTKYGLNIWVRFRKK